MISKSFLTRFSRIRILLSTLVSYHFMIQAKISYFNVFVSVQMYGTENNFGTSYF